MKTKSFFCMFGSVSQSFFIRAVGGKWTLFPSWINLAVQDSPEWASISLDP
jgi:hypothetical protein